MQQQHREVSNDSDREELALSFRILGWLLLALDWIIVVFVPIGLKEGSTLWAWWFGVQGFIGVSLVVAGYIMGEPVPLPAAAHQARPTLVRAASASAAATADAS